MVALSSRCLRFVLFVSIVLAASGVATARSQSSDTSRWDPARLRRVIEQRYTVVQLTDGVALMPRRPRGDVQSIQLSGDTVAINGTIVTGGELRDRLKSDSDAILALSYLDPEARKALFERSPSASPGWVRPSPPPSAAPSAEPAPPASHAAPAQSQPSEKQPENVTTRSSAKVHIGGSVDVGEHEAVDGPVVAIGGSANVNGEVREDVVAVGGNVHLGPTARVLGDVTVVGGTIDKDAKAEVDGKINEIGVRFPRIHWPSFWFPAMVFARGGFGPWVHLMGEFFRMLLFGFLACFALLIARTPIARIEQAVAVEPWKAGLVGLLIQMLFIPVFILTIVILVISIVGIPLVFVVAPLEIAALLIALVMGFTGVAYRVGRWAEVRFGWRQQSTFALLIVGLLGIWALTIVGRFVSMGGWSVWFLSSALLLAGFLVEYVAWTVGLGAAVITRLGSRPGTGGAIPPMPPPAAASPSAEGPA